MVALLAAPALAGCMANDDGEGSASFYVKDAPTDEFAEIHVVFSSIEVHKAGGSDDDETESNETKDKSASGWMTVYENATGADIDLLAASAPDAAYFLGEANLSAGKYTQIRIHTDAAYGVDLDGNRVNFTLSNGVLKVVRSFDVNASSETRIVLDFDLDRAIKGSDAGGWRMSPVIGKTRIDTVADSESGADVAQEGELTTV